MGREGFNPRIWVRDALQLIAVSTEGHPSSAGDTKGPEGTKRQRGFVGRGERKQQSCPRRYWQSSKRWPQFIVSISWPCPEKCACSWRVSCAKALCGLSCMPVPVTTAEAQRTPSSVAQDAALFLCSRILWGRSLEGARPHHPEVAGGTGSHVQTHRSVLGAFLMPRFPAHEGRGRGRYLPSLS